MIGPEAVAELNEDLRMGLINAADLTSMAASFFPRHPLAWGAAATAGAVRSSAQGGNPLLGAAAETGLQATGLIGRGMSAGGRQIFKGGLKEEAVKVFGDLGRMVSEGSIHPEQALKAAFALLPKLRKEAPLFMRREGDEDILRRAAGELTDTEMRGAAGKGRWTSTEIDRARRSFVGMLDTVIASASGSKASKIAQKMKGQLGLSMAETGAMSRAPSTGAAALGALMGGVGGAGGYAVGGPAGAILGATTGAGIPLFIGGHPTVQRGLGKTAYHLGRGAEAAIPAGLRGLTQLLRNGTRPLRLRDSKTKETPPGG